MADETPDIHQRLADVSRRSLAIVWTIVVWLIGAIFWAGTSYERFQSMDKHLENIDLKLDKLNQIDIVRQRQDDNMRRIEVLEKFMMEQQEKGR